MPPPFKRIDLSEFESLLARFDFRRRINAVHMHHTWRPTRSQFKGHDTLVAIWQFHTVTNKWRDIAQHATIDPEGAIWLGRDWNLAPASASGHNGNGEAGPFMFETVGNFDTGHDLLDGAQRQTVLGVIARVQRRFGLAPETLVFHNAMAPKTCPGSGVDYAQLVAELHQAHQALEQASRQPRSPAGGPFPEEASERSQAVEEAINLLTRALPAGHEPADAESDHREFADRQEAQIVPTAKSSRSAARQAGDSGLGPAQLAALRPHLVNLSCGRFSGEGEFKSTAGDVDAIFNQHLPAWLAQLPEGGRLRLLFYAHGGLVSESEGLKIAFKHIGWWKENGVYPIYFVWETGLFETVGSLLSLCRQRAARALARDLWDHTTDPLIEEAVRALQAPRIWGGMKRSAELAAAPEGGARYVAAGLSEFCARHGDRVELHACGHSAGAIFHSHFLPAALDHGVPDFKSLQLLAPAIRVDAFRERLLARIGKGRGIDSLSLFTMNRDYERDDNCAGIYRKSLLYLIHEALEDERKTDILGLETSLRADPGVAELLGLGPDPALAAGEVVWSVSAADSGRSASTSESHGGFDDDAPTMNSVARRILGREDADAIVEYTGEGSRAPINWQDQVDWPGVLRQVLPHGVPAVAAVSAPAPVAAAAQATVAGRRRALCVGIDRYPPGNELSGCVADARLWADTLASLGFEPPVLLIDGEARRAAILEQLGALLAESVAGDVLAFQFSGHGTQLPDLNGDEDDNLDEALCPVDFAGGAFLIDDDIAELFARIPPGVNVTCFMDCCHSGSNTRFAGGGTARPQEADARPRFIKPTAAMIAAHQDFRKTSGAGRALRKGGPERMSEVSFSACQPQEVAWESGGHGAFSLRATRVLRAGLAGVSNQEFAERVIGAFGDKPAQHVYLDCAAAARSAPLLQPLR